jgi:hypothetical protein
VNSVYVVRAIPVRDIEGGIAGWVRADVIADGSRSSDIVILRDGTAVGQVEGLKRVSADRTLLYASEAEAVRDGIEGLREADREGRDDAEACNCADCLSEEARGHVRDEYEDGNCPDCEEPIPDDAVEGSDCENCGHVFGYADPADAEV